MNATARGFTILKSIEMDILENGKLDLPDDVLAEADYVVATIHYGLTQPEATLTRRLAGAAGIPGWTRSGIPPAGSSENESPIRSISTRWPRRAPSRGACWS